MIVIGYKDRTQGHRIRIPDFHTGHLGFLPNIEVNIFGPHPAGNRSCDLVITPFQIDEHIVRVKCTFQERKGVLRRLVNLLAYLNINIISMESATFDQARYHNVFLLVDLKGSKLASQPLSPSEMLQYSYLLPLTHSTDRRVLELLSIIITQCHDILYWKTQRAVDIPAVSISPFLEQYFVPTNRHTRIIKREQRTKTVQAYTFVELDTETTKLSTLVARHIREEPSAEFDYILLSEPDTRTLRVEFFGSKRARQLIQIGFRHNDIPGAVDAITRTVAESNFNILVSILRKRTSETNDWEAVLEYTGGVLESEPEDPRTFMQEKLGAVVEKSRVELAGYDIEILVPPHVSRRRSVGQRFSQPIKLDRYPVEGPALPPPDLLPPELSSGVSRTRERVLLDASRIRDPAKWKTIFISCPKEANDLSDILETELKTAGWEITYYRGNTGASIAHREVRDLIQGCDCFIGIWHPAHGEENKEEPHTSPWMHYELGLAMAFRKEFKIIAQEKILAEARRVHSEPEVLHYKGTDDFRRVALKAALEFVNKRRESNPD